MGNAVLDCNVDANPAPVEVAEPVVHEVMRRAVEEVYNPIAAEVGWEAEVAASMPPWLCRQVKEAVDEHGGLEGLQEALRAAADHTWIREHRTSLRDLTNTRADDGRRYTALAMEWQREQEDGERAEADMGARADDDREAAAAVRAAADWDDLPSLPEAGGESGMGPRERRDPPVEVEPPTDEERRISDARGLEMLRRAIFGDSSPERAPERAERTGLELFRYGSHP